MTDHHGPGRSETVQFASRETMRTQHERFLERLAASSEAVFRVAQLQHGKGRTVEIPAIRRAPRPDVAEHYADLGDLFVVVRHRIEVKHLSINFTCSADWPFGAEVFVDNAVRVDHAGGDVLAYVSVSRDMSHIAVIARETRPHWYMVERRSRLTGAIGHYYACPIEHVVFEVLP